MRMRMAAGLAATAALMLAGCDNGGSAVETRERGAAEPVGLIAATAAEEAALPEAKPSVTANRRETADAKIQRLYERNGAAFGANSADDYLRKVKAFTENVPPGTETVKRANGDTLFYQASTNTFAVTDRKGVPRTMFKPDDGPTYWVQQKERAPTFGQRRETARAEE
ncbi:S-type pyocin family protein [Brevundimonas naejangsanensis]|uniref:S-type pyocin family protein n=1 Tax=Brevundimonas naejangsanensis TaxID=588932 RepID=A0A494RLV4_9CAUL|nr:S-type pyocin family protein [Brevundimonas naejangsanensis]AYG94734.1 S-type pyocin family protein [Brevundimonas naejangsanensis]